MKPLAGVRVADLSRLLPGSFATCLLADMGAEVIKVEQPGEGDYARQTSPSRFQVMNRNKQSVTCNLKHASGKELLDRLVRHSDVLVESYRPGVLARLGFGYETLAEINPQLVYCAISGYGQQGPYRTWPGHNLNYLGVAGAFAFDPNPEDPPWPYADYAAGLYAAFSIVTSLRARDQTQRGAFLDVSITDAMLAWVGPYLTNFMETGQRPSVNRKGAYDVFRTADGRFLTIGAREDAFWRNLCRAVGQEELLTDPRFGTIADRHQHHQMIRDIFGPIFASRDLETWLEELSARDVPVAPVLGPDEVFDHPQHVARGRIAGDGAISRQVLFPVIVNGFDTADAAPAPALGEHNETILGRLGYSAEAIRELGRSGAI